MRVTIRGKRWNLRFAKIKTDDGHCDGPHIKNKEIVICDSLDEQNELRVVLHEGLHAAAWDLDEEAIHETSRDLARILYSLGWRRHGESA